MPNPRILVVTRNLPPLKGGIERLMQHAIAEMARSSVCDVIGPTGCRPYLPEAHEVWELPPGLPWFHLRALARLLRSSKYDLVIAGNGLVAPLAGLAAARSRCPYAVFVHGLDLVVANALYQVAFMPWIRRADILVANSRYTAGLAEQRGVDRSRITVINPGVELRPPSDGAAFRATHRLGDRPVLLSVGRLVPRKGIAEFVERSLPQILRARPDACFVVIGDEPRHAAADAEGTRAAIKRACAAVPGSAVLMLGEVSDEELQQAYAAANAFVFPVLALPGDVEGFGMVALEAAAHGVPTIAFAVGGVVDAVGEGSGQLIEAGNYAAFAASVSAELRSEFAARRSSSRDWAAARTWRTFGERLRALIDTRTGVPRR
ncbi:MAG TPA: glycosyltransferase family 4 protein [Burkholderiales bacterium]|nr:glycosyltransferase family 4 protein [Burkholderiales bacterium]